MSPKQIRERDDALRAGTEPPRVPRISVRLHVRADRWSDVGAACHAIGDAFENGTAGVSGGTATAEYSVSVIGDEDLTRPEPPRGLTR